MNQQFVLNMSLFIFCCVCSYICHELWFYLRDCYYIHNDTSYTQHVKSLTKTKIYCVFFLTLYFFWVVFLQLIVYLTEILFPPVVKLYGYNSVYRSPSVYGYFVFVNLWLFCYTVIVQVFYCVISCVPKYQYQEIVEYLLKTRNGIKVPL